MSATVSVVPALIDALVSQATSALPDRDVRDGMGSSDRWDGNFLFIGVDDPATTGAPTSADAQQVPSTMATTRPRRETGQITCAAYSTSGDGNQKTARDAAYTTVEAVANLCRTTPNLGLTGWSLLVTSFGTTTHLTQAQSDIGADALVVFQISFDAKL